MKLFISSNSEPKRQQSLKGHGDKPDREDENSQEDAPKTFPPRMVRDRVTVPTRLKGKDMKSEGKNKR